MGSTSGRGVADELTREVHKYKMPMIAMSLKMSLYVADTELKGKDRSRRSRR
ncbi:MAG TPA: hypothetical protein VGH98_18240 [Gemmatimonadaceae bacterium]|jgi:hypothetical protein